MSRSHAPTLLTALAVALVANGGAVADSAPQPPRVTGMFRSMTLPPLAIEDQVSCEELRAASCLRPCKTWAGAQPDFQYSFDACVANCPKPNWLCLNTLPHPD